MNEDPSDWLSPAEEALAWQLAPFVRAVRQFILDAQTARARGLPLPLVQRLALASEAAKRELRGEPPAIADRIRIVAATRMLGTGIRVPDIVFTGSVALRPMTVAGQGWVTTALLPEPTEDHLPEEARKQVISRHLFLIVLITLIVLAVPAVILGSDLSSDAQVAILAYDGILAAYGAAYTFSERTKRKDR